MGIKNFMQRLFVPGKSKATANSLSRLAQEYFNGGSSARISSANIQGYLEKYADQAWVYSCIKIIQSKGAGVPLKVYQKEGDDLKWLPEHPLQKLLDSVNPFMSGYDLLESTHGFIELAGNAYWLLDTMIDGKPTEIYSLNPAQVKIKSDTKKYVTGYTYEIVPGVVAATFEPEEILHFKTWNPLDAFYGLAPICAARDSSDMMMFSDQYNKAFFKNGATPGGMLTSEQSLTDDEAARIKLAWKKTHQGVSKANTVALLDGGLKFEAMSSTHNDMQFTELKKMTREDVLTVFNMPPIMVGVFDEANYSNAREQRKIFWVDCMIPRLRKIESVINERLTRPFGDNIIVKHDLSGVEDIAEDMNKRAAADQGNVREGIVTINEVRKEKKLQPVEWGDVWWSPFGLEPINGPVKEEKPDPVNPPPPPAGPKKPEEEEDDKTDPAKSKRKEGVDNNQPEASDPDLVRRNSTWVRYKGFTEKQEKRWGGAMRSLFAAQEREVIANLQASDWQRSLNQNRLDKFKNTKASIDVILFDRSKSRTVFRRESSRLMTETLKGAAIKEINDYNLGIDFNLSDPNVTSWINNKSFKFADEVNDTTEAALRRNLQEAIENGESLSEVQNRIADVFDIARGSRTATIARTEVISASNEGAVQSYTQSGVVDGVEWIASRDNRVREEHQIDGETIVIGGIFSNGLKYPGDPEGEPSNVINCRCTVAPVVKERLD